MFSKLFSLTTLVAFTSAYTVLTPTLNSTITKGQSTSISWSTVDTDASDFSIYLVNFQDWPPTVISLAQNVPGSEGSTDVTIPCDVTSDYGWQINFINGTNTYVIYAQSSVFSLTGSCVDPTTSSSVSVSVETTTATATAYVTKNSTVTAYATDTATATTTAISKVIETVTFTSPIVWFVQPTSIGSMCAPEKTVTVYASGPSPTGSSSGHSGSGSSGTYGNSTTNAISKPSYSTTPSGTGSGAKSTSTSTTSAVFTGAATTVQAGSILALVAGAAAILL